MTTELSCQKVNNEVVATAKPQKDALIPRTEKTEAREDVLKPRLALSRGNWIHSELPEEVGTRDSPWKMLPKEESPSHGFPHPFKLPGCLPMLPTGWTS